MKKNKNKNRSGDIQESPKDNDVLGAEETTLNLPDVKDIPGQEHVRPPQFREFADATVASADEEGIVNPMAADGDGDATANVTKEEKELLERSVNSMSTQEDISLERARLDNEDEDGEPLNEESEFSGKDLDVPGSEEDDEDEELGEEDEENNSYSLGGDRHEP